jgi:molybdenum cofactor biosynthesis enzyme MoaA
MNESLFELPELPRRPRIAVAERYICPQCWQRIEVVVPLDEAPFCDACRCRTLRESQPSPAPEAPAFIQRPLDLE